MINIGYSKFFAWKTARLGRLFPTFRLFRNEFQPFAPLPGMKSLGLPLMLLAMLSGCQTPPIKPSAQQLQRIGRVLVVPVESPPLEVIPDPIKTRMPAYSQYHYENVPSTLLMTQKLYRNPGGILIAGLVGGNDTVEVTDQQDKGAEERPASLASASGQNNFWSPSRILAKNAVKQLTSNGIAGIQSEFVYRLPVSMGVDAAQHGAWRDAIDQWYGQSRSTMDYRQPVHQFDAVLEIGIGSYRIFENQTSLRVLVKLIDPDTRQVIGRSSAETYSAEDTAQSLLSEEAGRFKALMANLGKRLVAHGLSDLGLPIRHSANPNQVAFNN